MLDYRLAEVRTGLLEKLQKSYKTYPEASGCTDGKKDTDKEYTEVIWIQEGATELPGSSSAGNDRDACNPTFSRKLMARDHPLYKPTLKRYKVLIWVLTFMAYTSYHMSRKPISVVKSVLYKDCSNKNGSVCHSWKPFDDDNADALLGSLDYAFLFAYAIGMFFSGHIAERINLRYFLTAGMLGSGLFTILFGLAQYWNIHNFGYFVFVQVVGGLFQSTGWPSVVAAVANWFGKGKRGIIMGLWNAHTSVGNILGGIIPGFFADYKHWGLAFIVPGLIIAAMGVLVFMILVPEPEDVGLESPNKPSNMIINVPGDSSSDEAGDVSESDPLSPNIRSEDLGEQKAITIWSALKIPGVVQYSLSLFFAKLVSYTFLFWLPMYISKTSHYGPEKSADLATIFDVGGIIGSVAAGAISDVTRGPGTTCAVMLAMAAPSLYMYQLYGHLSGSAGFGLSVELLLLCGTLVNGPYGLITTAVSADLGTHQSLRGNSKALSTVTAIIDGTGSIGAALGPLFTGLVSHTGWKNVFFMLIAADLMALLMLSRIVYLEIKGWCSKSPSL